MIDDKFEVDFSDHHLKYFLEKNRMKLDRKKFRDFNKNLKFEDIFYNCQKMEEDISIKSPLKKNSLFLRVVKKGFEYDLEKNLEGLIEIRAEKERTEEYWNIMNQRYRFKIQDFDIVQNSEEKQMVSSTTESDKNERISDQYNEHLLFED